MQCLQDYGPMFSNSLIAEMLLLCRFISIIPIALTFFTCMQVPNFPQLGVTRLYVT